MVIKICSIDQIQGRTKTDQLEIEFMKFDKLDTFLVEKIDQYKKYHEYLRNMNTRYTYIYTRYDILVFIDKISGI